MKNKFIHLLRVLPLVVIFLTPYLAVSAQELKVNRVYAFSGNTDTLNSEIRFVYPDSNRIYILGQGFEEDTIPYIFTAAVDYSGNLLWKKNLSINPGLKPLLKDGYHNLIKLQNGTFAAGGNLYHYPLSGGRFGVQPFLYFFNAQGDSLRYEVLADSGAKRTLNSLNLKESGGFIAAGVDSLLDYNGEINTENDSLENYWFARINSNGSLEKLNKISIQQATISIPVVHNDSSGLPRYIVKGVFPVNGDSVKYVVHVQWILNGLFLGVNIETDSNFYWLGSYKFGRGIWSEKSTYVNSNHVRAISLMSTILVGLSHNYLNAGVHNGKYKFYYNNPGFLDYNGESDEVNYDGTVLGRVDSVPLEPPPGSRSSVPLSIFLDFSTWVELLGHENVTITDSPLAHVSFYQNYFPLTTAQLKATLHASHLAAAANGDLLLYQEAYLPVDSASTNDIHPPSFLTPFVLRVDDGDGHVEWGMKIQYAPTKNDSSVNQHILDIAVAPSGCLVLGGSVNVHQPIPGYDSVGKNSWLVMLCDSLHDHDTTAGIKIPSLGSKAEITVYPNPTLDNAFVVLQHFEGNLQDIQLQLCDINGRVLQSRKCSSNKELIQMKGYPSGIYFIKVLYHGKLSGTVKLVKD